MFSNIDLVSSIGIFSFAWLFFRACCYPYLPLFKYIWIMCLPLVGIMPAVMRYILITVTGESVISGPLFEVNFPLLFSIPLSLHSDFPLLRWSLCVCSFGSVFDSAFVSTHTYAFVSPLLSGWYIFLAFPPFIQYWPSVWDIYDEFSTHFACISTYFSHFSGNRLLVVVFLLSPIGLAFIRFLSCFPECCHCLASRIDLNRESRTPMCSSPLITVLVMRQWK